MLRFREETEDHAKSLFKALEELQDIKAENHSQTVEKAEKTSDTQNQNQTKQLIAMMGRRDENRKPKGKKRRDRSQYNQQRNTRKRYHEKRKQSNRKHSSRPEYHSEYDDTSSDEEY